MPVIKMARTGFSVRAYLDVLADRLKTISSSDRLHGPAWYKPYRDQRSAVPAW